jgi:hypothetical protein
MIERYHNLVIFEGVIKLNVTVLSVMAPLVSASAECGGGKTGSQPNEVNLISFCEWRHHFGQKMEGLTIVKGEALAGLSWNWPTNRLANLHIGQPSKWPTFELANLQNG